MAESTERGRGQRPAASPAARWWAVLIGVLFLAIAVVAGREILLRNIDSLNWASWTDPVLDIIAQNSFQDWMTWASILLTLVGLILLIVAFKPRKKRYVSIADDLSLWARPVDLARYTTATAKAIPGIITATTTVHSKKVKVDAVAAPGSLGVQERLSSTVNDRLSGLVGNSTINVAVTEDRSNQEENAS